MNTLVTRSFALLLLTVGAPRTATAEAWQERNESAPPAARSGHGLVWTGIEMIVWGGRGAGATRLNTGGRYDPVDNTWTAMTTTGAPTGRSGHTAVWTGGEMIIWGGTGPGSTSLITGGRYDPVANSWTPMSPTGAPDARSLHTAVWTGNEMIVWGGTNDSGPLNNGGRYNPADNTWTPVTTSGAPSARRLHTAVWTGGEMIVWGGSTGLARGVGSFSNGRRYNPAVDRWSEVTTSGAPSRRDSHTAVWTGTEMIVWGGADWNAPERRYDYWIEGGRYNPAGDTWTEVSITGAPAGRWGHTAVWTGSEMIAWAGYYTDNYLNDGGSYNPARNSWTALPTNGAPAGRSDHTAVWTGSEMIVWGGSSGDGTTTFPLNDTFTYTPDCRAFRITSVVLDSGNLTLSFPTVPDQAYTLWRSDTLAGATWTNTGLPALAGTGATLSFTIPATAPASRFFRVHADPHP